MQYQLELLKWLALVAMTVDHYGKIVEPALYEPSHAIGRLAYPLFAWVLASRLANRPALAAKYLQWLLPCALLSQPVFVLAGKSWWDWNIMFTLFFGVLACQGVSSAREGAPLKSFIFFGISLAGSWFSEYGPFGVLLVPTLVMAIRQLQSLALVALGMLSLTANITLAAPHLTGLDVFALLSAPIVYIAQYVRATIPRVPKPFFYAYYPAHVYVLHAVDIYLL